MKKESNIKKVNTRKYNKAEVANFHEATVNNLLNVGYAKLGVTKEKFDPYNANKALLRNIVSQGQMSYETPLIAELRARLEGGLRFFLGTIVRGRKSSIEADRIAYAHLYGVVKPYLHIMDLPQRQLVQQTRGLVLDVSSAGSSEYIVQQKLTELVQSIENTNVELAAQIGDRAETQVERDLPNSEEVREEMVGQYDDIMTDIFATHRLTPTSDTEKFVTRQNKLIDDTEALYNLRMGILHANKKKKEEAEAEAEAAQGARSDCACEEL